MLDFAVDTHEEGERVRRASAVLREGVAAESPGQFDVAALTVAHPCRVEGDQLRKVFDSMGIQYGSAFSGLVAAHTPEGEITSVLAEVALPSAIRSQHTAYRSHPALLDACFQSVIVHPEVQNAASGGLLRPSVSGGCAVSGRPVMRGTA